MLRHVVLFRWSSTADDAAKAAVGRGLDALPGAIGTVDRFHHGPDAGLAEGNWDHAVVADFADNAAYVHYRDHPAHQELLKQGIRPILADRSAVQYFIRD